MIRESTPTQKQMLANMLTLAQSLQVRERDIILRGIEGAHIPPDYRYLVEDRDGVIWAAYRAEEFVGAIFGIAWEALAHGVTLSGSRDPMHPARFSEAEIVAYAERKPRVLSLDLVDAIMSKVPDRMIGLAATALLDSAYICFFAAKKMWPKDWMLVELSDIVKIRMQLPAPNEQRLALIRRLAQMRLRRTPGALATMELIGEKLQDMDELTLLSSMDASVFAITEQFFQLTAKTGFATDAVIRGLHNMRVDACRRVSGQELPDFIGPYTVGEYARFYLHHVHSHGVAIDFHMIPVAIRMVCAFYGRPSESCFSENPDQVHRN